jgi:PPK2 family polyphosphate:nucleotide phosphotransferase
MRTMPKNLDSLRVKPGSRVRLRDFDPDDKSTVPGDKEKVAALNTDLQKRIGELQELLYAGQKHKVLLVLQGMDTSGKDGAVRHVMSESSPQGLRVYSFKKPTETELAHDYLWRVHAQVPGSGEIVVFNRSHYEDVLVVRVHSLVGETVWRKRYEQINDFERMLCESGTTIIKCFLHISKDEQRERLQARLDDPTKRWKFQHGDLEERKLWDDYTAAYEDALSRTSTKDAPWYVIPANRKWVRNYLVADILVRTLEKLKMTYPEPDLSDVRVE